MDLATSALELSNSGHNNMSQQQSAVSPVSPLRPAPIPSSQMMPLAVSNYYTTPPTLLHHHGQQQQPPQPQQLQQQQQQQHDGPNNATKLKLTHAASGNGLGSSLVAKSNEHKTNDQVVTDQAREILRQAVVSATSGFTENAGGGAVKSGAVNVAPKAENAKSKGAVRYRECQKNHAASIGGHAMDGCGEFMPSGGRDDDIDSLRCAACDCHRNFHRREVEGEVSCDCKVRKLPKPGHGSPLQPTALMSHPGTQTLALTAGPNQMTPLAMAAAMSAGGPTDSDEQDDGPGNIVTSAGAMHLSMRSPSAIKKRFRTKFTTDQKDQMSAFAEKVGWRIQKHDEGAVQEFCTAVGVKRHVLKVWMHNNKHTVGKKP
ncbi:hypothetical protein KC19_11G036000 [Ceratodon purpureus]|uniref:ZF-HD dimerization-type domain-containing protein n=1 Tax=Ceratodon purpureus TaxID=3225 RepID=A0A8T0GAP7_CERPU|nr:hypothetical protein KC19_11G036000 [Ceratodon purpureus]